MKGFIPLLPNLLSDTDQVLQLATLKGIGTFASLAAIVPIRMQNFYKELLELGILTDVCLLLKTAGNNVNGVNALHMVAAQVLSTLICPVYGEFYSFPWKRGPHDNILEFVEANQIFESLRQVVFNGLRDFDFVSKLLIVMQKEDEA